MLNTIFRKLNTFKRISFLDKNIKNYVALNKEIFNQKSDTKKKIDGIILIDFFDWNPFIFFWLKQYFVMYAFCLYIAYV